MNLNVLFDILTNFKIKFTKHPSPTQVGNMNLKFKLKRTDFDIVRPDDEVEFPFIECRMQGIQLSQNSDEVEIILIEEQ